MLQAILDLVTSGQMADVTSIIADVIFWEE